MDTTDRYVAVGDKSGALGVFSLSGEAQIVPYRLSRSSLDQLQVIRNTHALHGFHLRGVEALVGCRSGDLFHILVGPDGARMRVTKRLLKSFGAPICGLVYDSASSLYWVGLQSGELSCHQFRGHPIGAEQILSINLGEPIQHLAIGPAASESPSENLLYVATKLGRLHRIPFLPTENPLSVAKQPWHTLDTTLNCLLPLPTSQWLMGCFVGTNAGLSWVGETVRTSGAQTQHFDFDGPSRVMSLCFVPAASELSAAQKQDSPPHAQPALFLIAAHQNGSFNAARIPGSPRCVDDILAACTGASYAEPLRGAVFTVRSVNTHGTRRQLSPRLPTTARILCGTRDHKLLVLDAVDQDYVGRSMRTMLGGASDPARFLSKILDTYPYDHALRAGLARFVLEVLDPLLGPDAITADCNAMWAYSILLRCLRYSTPYLQRYVLRGISRLSARASNGGLQSHWISDLAEFVEKYVVGGWTFASKRICLRQLAQFNKESAEGVPNHRSYLDAAIYFSRLADASGVDLTHITRTHPSSLIWDIAVAEVGKDRYLIAASDAGPGVHVYRILRVGLEQPLQLEPIGVLSTRSTSVQDESGRCRSLLIMSQRLIVATRQGRMLSYDLEAACTEPSTCEARLLGEMNSNESVYCMLPDPALSGAILLSQRDGRITRLVLPESPGSEAVEQASLYCSPQGGLDQYRPIRHLSSADWELRSALVAAATSSGAVLLSGSGADYSVVWEEANSSPCNSISFGRQPSHTQPGILVAGYEDGAIRAYTLTVDGAVDVFPLWGFQTSNPVRDIAMYHLDDHERFVASCLDGHVYEFTPEGELVREAEIGIPANVIRVLDTRKSEHEDCRVVSVAIGGEAPSNEIALAELTPKRHWMEQLRFHLQPKIPYDEKRVLLQKAAACDAGGTAMIKLAVGERYEQELDTTSRDALVDDIALRITSLLETGYRQDRASLLDALCVTYYRFLGLADNQPESMQLMRALRLAESIQDQWSSYGSVENNRVLLLCTESMIESLSSSSLQHMCQEGFRQAARGAGIRALDNHLEALLHHPSQRIRYSGIALVERIAGKLRGMDESTGWLPQMLLACVSQNCRVVADLDWITMRACRAFHRTTQLLRIEAAMLAPVLIRFDLPRPVLEYLLRTATDSGVRELIHAKIRLRDAVACGDRAALLSVLRRVAGLLDSPKVTLSTTGKALLDILSLLEKLVAVNSIETWDPTLQFPNSAAPLLGKPILQVTRDLQNVYECVSRCVSARGRREIVDRARASRAIEKLSFDGAESAAGSIGRVAVFLRATWEEWLRTERLVRLPHSILDGFSPVPVLSVRSKSPWDDYRDSMRDLFALICIAVNACSGSLHIAHEGSLTSWTFRSNGPKSQPQYVRQSKDTEARILAAMGDSTGRSDGMSIAQAFDPGHTPSEVILTPSYWNSHCCLAFTWPRESTDAARLLTELSSLPSVLQANYLLRLQVRELSEIVRLGMHNLKTPVHTFHVMVSELVGRRIPPESLTEHYSTLLDITTYFQQVVELVVKSKREIEMRPAKHDLREIFRSAATIVGRYWHPQHRRIHIEDYGRALPIQCDRALILDAVYVVLDNACKYSLPEDSSGVDIHVEFKRYTDRVVAHVIDTGIGIPLEEQEAIFDYNVIGERAKSLNFDGSGIGLYVARRNIAAQKGTLEVTSSGEEGDGSIFTIDLPRRGA